MFNKIHNRKKKKTYYKRGKMDIINGVKKVISIYEKREFKIDTINADNECKKIEGEIGPHVEICARENTYHELKDPSEHSRSE